MNKETVTKLKNAVAQFRAAYRDMNECLHHSLTEATERNQRYQTISRMVTDQALLDRIEHEIGIATDDECSLHSAWWDWTRIHDEIGNFFGNVEHYIDQATCDALSYDDFKANEAKTAEIELKRRRDDIRPMTHEEMECLVRKDLRAYAKDVLKLEPVGTSETRFRLHDKRVISVVKSHLGIWGWWVPSGPQGSIWHLEAIVRDIPKHEALTNVRLHFGTESLSARVGDIPSVEGLKSHWAREANIQLREIFPHAGSKDWADVLLKNNEAVWEQRMIEAAEAEERIQIAAPKTDAIGIYWVTQNDQPSFTLKERRRAASILKAEGADL